MRKCTKVFPIYEEVVSHKMTFHPIPLNFLIYEENFIFFLSVQAAWSVHQVQKKREGMGLLEYQAMPLWRDVAHDGWLCFTYITAAENPELFPSQLISRYVLNRLENMVTHFAHRINIFSGCERPPTATVYI